METTTWRRRMRRSSCARTPCGSSEADPKDRPRWTGSAPSGSFEESGQRTGWSAGLAPSGAAGRGGSRRTGFTDPTQRAEEAPDVVCQQARLLHRRDRAPSPGSTPSWGLFMSESPSQSARKARYRVSSGRCQACGRVFPVRRWCSEHCRWQGRKAALRIAERGRSERDQEIGVGWKPP